MALPCESCGPAGCERSIVLRYFLKAYPTLNRANFVEINEWLSTQRMSAPSVLVHIGVGRMRSWFTMRCYITLTARVFYCHYYHQVGRPHLPRNEIALTCALKSPERIIGLLVLTPCRLLLISSTFLGTRIPKLESTSSASACTTFLLILSEMFTARGSNRWCTLGTDMSMFIWYALVLQLRTIIFFLQIERL